MALTKAVADCGVRSAQSTNKDDEVLVKDMELIEIKKREKQFWIWEERKQTDRQKVNRVGGKNQSTNGG